MNIIKFVESFTDDNLTKATGNGRESFGQFRKIGKNLALTSIPFGLSALVNKSYAADITPTPKYTNWCITTCLDIKIARR